MKVFTAFALLFVFLTCGCATFDKSSTTVPVGTKITTVQAAFDVPDAISDESGALKRYYLPTHRPAYEWPWDAPRQFYYLDRNLVVTFVRGKTTRSEPMTDSDRKLVQELKSRNFNSD